MEISKNVTLEKISDIFGINKTTLRIKASRREFPLYKLGTRVYVNVDEFRSWLNQFKVEPRGKQNGKRRQQTR